MTHDQPAPLFGIGAEFATAEELMEAVHALRGRRLGRLDAFTPVPVPGLAEALGFSPEAVRPVAVAGVLVAFAAFLGMCVYATGYAYRFNIGGRPDVSWPSYLVPSFAFALMAAAVLVLLGMLVLNRLPRLNHPAFNMPGFTRVSQDRFFLAVEPGVEGFEPAAVEQALRALNPIAIHQVPR